MRGFTWNMGMLSAGIEVVNDPRWKSVVLLGQEGPGRRYEKIQMGKRDPAIVERGKVYQASPFFVELPPKEDKPAHCFWVLERVPRQQGGFTDPEAGLELVRVTTHGQMVRDTRGYWKTVLGAPRELVKGYGAQVEFKKGDPQAICLWDDGLFVMRDGDVLKVVPCGGPRMGAWAIFKFGDSVASLPWADFVQAASTCADGSRINPFESEIVEVEVELPEPAEEAPAVAAQEPEPVKAEPAPAAAQEPGKVIELRPEPEPSELVIEQPVSKKERKRQRKEKAAAEAEQQEVTG